MKQKRYVGTFPSVDNALTKITELKSFGYTKDEILAVSNLEGHDRKLEEQTDIVLATREQEGYIERIKTFFTNDQPAIEAFEHLGFNEQQTQAFYNEVKDGGVALFVLDDPKSPKHADFASGNRETTTPRSDSSGEVSTSGIPLENAQDEIAIQENAGRYPRINTNNL